MLFCIPLLQRVVIWVTLTFLSALTSFAILPWPLLLTRHFNAQNCRSLDVFSFSHHLFSAPTLVIAVHENPRESASNHPVKHQQSFHGQSGLDHISSPFWCLVCTTTQTLDHVCILLCIDLLPHDCWFSFTSWCTDFDKPNCVYGRRVKPFLQSFPAQFKDF